MTELASMTIEVIIDGVEYEADQVGSSNDDDGYLARLAVESRFDDIVELPMTTDQLERTVYEGVCKIVRTETTFVRWRYDRGADASEETEDYDPAWTLEALDTPDQKFSF